MRSKLSFGIEKVDFDKSIKALSLLTNLAKINDILP